ncbi:hypothetical protein ASD46_22840 [Rhizobium sp. Root491]|nr:hypothetical protein ASD46_22840 [Rhizobium sp. Root491]
MKLLLQFMMAGSFALVLLVLLVFIWPRREGLRRVFGSGVTDSSGGHDYLPHTGGCNDTGLDGGSGNH